MLLAEFADVRVDGSCVRIYSRSLQFKIGRSCVFHSRKLSRVSLIGTFRLIVLLVDGNTWFVPRLAIAVDEFSFAICHRRYPGSGSDTM